MADLAIALYLAIAFLDGLSFIRAKLKKDVFE